VTIVRSDQSSGGTASHAYQHTPEEDYLIAQNALQTLRVAAVSNG